MTLIASIKTKKGFLLAADSKELISGGCLLWEDFDEILQVKGVREESTQETISPSEITEKFKSSSQTTQGRIKNYDGAKKLFKLNDNAALLVAGIANPGGKEFHEITEIINNECNQKKYGSDNLVDTTYSILKELLENDSSESKYEAEYFLCGYNKEKEEFYSFYLKYSEKLILENGKPKLDENGRMVHEKVFVIKEYLDFIKLGGWTAYLRELNNLNQFKISTDFEQAYNLIEAIMNFAIQIEKTTYKTTGIGGEIYYAIITKKGFQRINSKSELIDI